MDTRSTIADGYDKALEPALESPVRREPHTSRPQSLLAAGHTLAAPFLTASAALAAPRITAAAGTAAAAPAAVSWEPAEDERAAVDPDAQSLLSLVPVAVEQLIVQSAYILAT